MSDTCYPIKKSLSCIRPQASRIASWLIGPVLTPQGIVQVFCGRKHTCLTFIHRRRVHHKTFERDFDIPQLFKLARDMARRVSRKR